jgi:hypothetical protein
MTLRELIRFRALGAPLKKRRMTGSGHGETNSAQSFLVRSTSVSRIHSRAETLPGSANYGPEQMQQILCAMRGYSITSSASCWRWAGTSRPSALAVFMLITSSNLTGAWFRF